MYSLVPSAYCWCTYVRSPLHLAISSVLHYVGMTVSASVTRCRRNHGIGEYMSSLTLNRNAREPKLDMRDSI